ncbi:hypothetical protein [Nocardioides jishulii]|uniref:Uncharacterized protein n=1 Tax=Nocardioides jishulii TaxID=2575440 RepID=A0A4V5TR19_9ACTN|nr:hypothetical protein [Nocardioides jishulii]QCX26830.1 hypothetical protein FCL41_04195 [Nocardioides jishulii]TKI61313.1 hypothetical protein FC770_10830 [Nocardioides jishulii]
MLVPGDGLGDGVGDGSSEGRGAWVSVGSGRSVDGSGLLGSPVGDGSRVSSGSVGALSRGRSTGSFDSSSGGFNSR